MTPELAELRRGNLTASMAAVIMGDLKTDGLARYVRKLAGERVYGDLGEEGFTSAKMQDGTECEPEALEWAEFHFDRPLVRGPHIVHPSIPYVAATPDAVLDGIPLEIKSPLFHVWADTLERSRRVSGIEAIPSQYRWQCRWQCWCLGVLDGKFISYHRRSGAVVIAFTVTDDEIAQMEKRAQVVEGLVRNWVELLNDGRLSE
jgi:hypothetical protein